MEDRAVLQFFLFSLLCLFQTGTSSSQCLDNVPQYGSRGTGTPDEVPRLAEDNIYIMPNYTFSCYGNVTQWGVCVEGEGERDVYDIFFIVARPVDDRTNCYRGIDNNRIVDGTAIDGCITLNVPESDQISVEPGDVVVLSHSVSAVSAPMVDNGIEVDVTATRVTVWSDSIEDFQLNDLICEYNLGPGGNFPSSTAAAPVITAVVEPLRVPSTPSPSHSTSSHSPVPSTPSPSTIPSPSSPTQDGGSTLSTSTVAGIAAGAVGGVLIIIIIMLLIIIAILKSKVKDTSTGELRAEMKSNESYATTSTTHSDMEIKNNGAYQSANGIVTMEQNEAYSGTVVGATQDVIYEEIDGLYEELR